MRDINLKLSIQDTHINAKVEEMPVYAETLSNDMKEVKQVMVEKGIVNENASNSELSGAIGNITTLKGLFALTKTANSLFKGQSEITDVSNIIKYDDTSEVTNMDYMFQDCAKLEKAPFLDTSKVTTMKHMFSNNNSYLYNTKIKEIPLYDTSEVTNMQGAFNGLWALERLPNLNTSKVTDMSYLVGFGDSWADNRIQQLKEFPPLDTSNVTNMSYMFAQCGKLKTIPFLNTSNVISMSYMFQNCVELESLPDLDYSKVTSAKYLFEQCKLLEEINIGMITPYSSVARMFTGCTNLKTINGTIDLINVSDTTYIFNDCTNLTYLNLVNIKVDIRIGSGTLYGHLLTLDSLINTCKECIKQSSNKKLTMGSANLEKIANVYVKFTDPTQTEIASGEKGDVVVCESTDEGAMTMETYMTLKNWQIL